MLHHIIGVVVGAAVAWLTLVITDDRFVTAVHHRPRHRRDRQHPLADRHRLVAGPPGEGAPRRRHQQGSRSPDQGPGRLTPRVPHGAGPCSGDSRGARGQRCGDGPLEPGTAERGRIAATSAAAESSSIGASTTSRMIPSGPMKNWRRQGIDPVQVEDVAGQSAATV